jgi:hypothetical protein
MGTKSSAAVFQRAMDQVLAPFSNTNRFKVRHVRVPGPEGAGGAQLEVTPAAMGSVRPGAQNDLARDRRLGWAFGTAFAYVDDVLVCSMGSREEHVALVDAVLSNFAKFEFTFKLSKTELYKTEMDFLGHRLTQHGLARQAAKVEAIQQWAMPTTQAELRSFISVVGYYRRFIDGFASVAQPLTDLLREGRFEYPLPAAAQAAVGRARSGSFVLLLGAERVGAATARAPGRNLQRQDHRHHQRDRVRPMTDVRQRGRQFMNRWAEGEKALYCDCRADVQL